MKTLPVALAAHVAQGTTTLAHLLKITRTDGAVYAFTGASRSVTIGGVLYRAAPGLDVSSLSISAGLAVDNLELTTLDDGSTFSRIDVLGGVWRNAAFLISRYNWASPADGTDPVMAGTLGDVQLRSGTIVAELRGLQQYLQQNLGSVTSKTCRARLGDSLCRVDLAPWSVTGTVTAVSSGRVFTDAARAEADGWFADGVLTFTSGACAGLRQKVKAIAAGQITLSLPMLQAITVGDGYSLIAGCSKRLTEDCVGKFDNALNFQGEPHLPGVDTLTKSA